MKTSSRPVNGVFFSHIAAASSNNALGFHGKLPWNIPKDLRFFHKTTMNKSVIMGRKTFESLGKPLPGRMNVVVTRNRHFPSKPGSRASFWTGVQNYIPLWTGGMGQLVKTGAFPESAGAVVEKYMSLVKCSSIKDAMDFCSRKEVLKKYGTEVFIIGGGQIYKQTLPFANRIYLTRIHKNFQGDAFYPKIPESDFQEIQRKDFPCGALPFSFLIFERRK